MRNLNLSLALAGLLGFSAAPAHASFIEANVAAGYTTLAMEDLNTALKGTNSLSHTPINSGFYLSGDVGVSVLPFLKFGPRVAFISAVQGQNSHAGTPNNSASTVDAHLVPMELGLSADLGAPLTGISLRAGLWGGYGLANVAVSTKNSNGVVTGNLYQGGGFTAELLAAVRYSILPTLSLSLETGYRMANIAKVSDGANELKKNATDALPIDFSGVNFGGGVSFSF
jgi:hypothetical protein